MLFLRSFMSSASRVGGHRRVAALELMKRDAARTRTGPNVGADTHLFHFFLLSRIPSGQPAVGFRCGLTGHTSVRCVEQPFDEEELGLSQRGDARLSLANSTRNEFQDNLTQSSLAPWHDAVGGGCGALSPTIYCPISLPCVRDAVHRRRELLI